MSAQPARAATDGSAADIAREFRDYAYIVSHDLGAPARLMVEFSRLLAARQGAFANEEDRRLVREIADNGDKLRAMMQGLLAYSRLNTLAAQHMLIDTRKVAEHAVLLMRDKLKARSGKLSLGDLPQLMGDPDQVMQLFSFLIDNAIRFARPGVPPEIHLAAERSGDMWQFSLKDNGIGIDAEDWQKVFKPFQRMDAGDDQAGTGMGLALARKIVGLHGGEIRIAESSPTGTTVSFTLRD